MRIARPPLIAGLFLALAMVPPPLASAGTSKADATRVVRGLNALPSNLSFGLFGRSCTNPGQPAPAGFGRLIVRKGPSPVPAGRRTWGFVSSGAGGAIGPFRAVPAMADLTTARLQVYADQGGADAIGYADVFADDSATTSWWGVTTDTLHVSAGAWATVDTVASTYQWQEFGSGGPTGSTFSGTVSEMVDHVGSDHGGLVGIGVGCGSGDSFHVDAAQFGSSGDVTTYDLEGPRTHTTIRASGSVVRAGGRVTLRGVTSETGGITLPRALLTLQARRFDQSSWKDVGTDTATFDTSLSPAQIRKRPLVRTAYRWVFRENQAYDGSRSGAFTVRVRTAVTARPADTMVKKGDTIKITGRVTPAKPGEAVTLSKGGTKVGSAVVRRTGTYTVTAKANTRGVWRLHVAIGASSGNLAGASREVQVTVR
jgi:hypothetical protein